MPSTPETNIVLFVGLTPALLGPIQALKKKKGVNYRYAIIHDTKTPTPEQKEVLDVFDIEIKTNFSSRDTLTKSLQPYEHELLAITSRSESNIPYFQKVIPHVPYLRTPTTESLTWATEKLKMRQQLNSYDKNIGPAFMIVHDSAKKTIKEIEEKVGFPVVIKPTGLVRGLLVTAAYHHEELEKELNRVFWKINKLHRDTNGRGEPSVLVEQLMDGEMYSVDAHVTSRGTIHFNPFVHVKTGRSIGFDDFFSYQQITPTRLNKQSVADAQEVTEKAIRALGLRSTTAHV
ncbi:MAG: ATP-grasp domain-containing protein, partial [Candidatus Paceibacterota bacterium]